MIAALEGKRIKDKGEILKTESQGQILPQRRGGAEKKERHTLAILAS